VIQGVSVLPTLSLPHSVYMIAKLVRHRVYGLGYDIPLRGTAPKHASKAAAFVLEGFPGISANLARRLLKHFDPFRPLPTPRKPSSGPSRE
jgi:ERCC4-type nuclease